MKKLLAILLALMMVLVSVAALAGEVPADNPSGEQTEGEGGEGGTEGGEGSGSSSGVIIAESQKDTLPGSFKLTKTYTKTGDTAIVPPDTLQFTVSKVVRTDSSSDISAEDQSEAYPVTISNVTVSQGAASADITVSLPSYDLPGVYHYTIDEVDTNVAGVGYLADTLYLKITVITEPESGDLVVAGVAVHKGSEDGEKIDTFENTYKAGSLLVSKTVTGKLGDYTLDFDFKVTFTAPTTGTEQDIVKLPITVSFPDGQDKLTTSPEDIAVAAWSEGKAEATFTLKHGQSVTFSNIPENTTYVVEETENKDYTTTPGLKIEGTIATSEAEAAFTNDRDIDIDNGVSLDSVVYMLIMALALAGFVVLKIRRREDY